MWQNSWQTNFTRSLSPHFSIHGRRALALRFPHTKRLDRKDTGCLQGNCFCIEKEKFVKRKFYGAQMANFARQIAHCVVKTLSRMCIFFLLLLLSFYGKFISPLLGSSKCRFLPTCSQYARQALENFGFVAGLYLAIKRLLRCAPWSKGGYDPLPSQDEFTRKHKILSYISNF